MNQEVSKYEVTISPHDYKFFVINRTVDEAMIERIARQESNWEIACLVDKGLWNEFQARPFDPGIYNAVRVELEEVYYSSRNQYDHKAIETLKAHVQDRIGEQVHQMAEEVKHLRLLMLEVETIHDLHSLIPHLVREFGMDHGALPMNEIIGQVLFLLHPELFEHEAAGDHER